MWLIRVNEDAVVYKQRLVVMRLEIIQVVIDSGFLEEGFWEEVIWIFRHLVFTEFTTLLKV